MSIYDDKVNKEAEEAMKRIGATNSDEFMAKHAGARITDEVLALYLKRISEFMGTVEKATRDKSARDASMTILSAYEDIITGAITLANLVLQKACMYESMHRMSVQGISIASLSDKDKWLLRNGILEDSRIDMFLELIKEALLSHKQLVNDADKENVRKGLHVVKD